MPQQSAPGGTMDTNFASGVNAAGSTRLHHAAVSGDAKKVAELLASGADPNIRDVEGWTPLHNACSVGWLPEHRKFGPEHAEIVTALLAASADVDAQSTTKRYAPLHVAYMSRRPELVALLVAAGANCELRDKDGNVPGYWYGRPEIAAILAAHGVKP